MKYLLKRSSIPPGTSTTGGYNAYQSFVFSAYAPASRLLGISSNQAELVPSAVELGYFAWQNSDASSAYTIGENLALPNFDAAVGTCSASYVW